MAAFTPSSRANPCPVCGRTKDGDCRTLDSGLVLCHTTLNGVGIDEKHPDRPFVYRGHSDEAQGFGKWKPVELCEDRADKAPRKPDTHYFDYQFWDGTPTPAQRYRKDAPGKPKDVKWCKGGLGGRRQSEVAPYRWAKVKAAITAGDILLVVRGELKANLLAGRGFHCISLLNQTDERLISELRALVSQQVAIVLIPDNDLADLDHWYANLVAAIPQAKSLLCPLKGMDWRNPPDDHGLGIEDWLIRSLPSNDDILAAITDSPWGATAVGPDKFLRDAESLKARLDDGLQKIDAIPDVATRSVALHTLRGSLDLGRTEFESLIQALSEAKAPRATESFDKLMAEDDDDLAALVEDFLPAGIVLVAAEGFAGKSNTGYQVAEAVTNGSKFAGQFQCQKAPVLIIQMDESKTDAKRKFKVLGLKPATGALTIKWHFSPMMFPELRRWVAESGAKLVVLDSLMTIAGGQISPKDAEFGLLIYRLNLLASELGLTVVCLHHVVKAGSKQRTEITKEDIFGTAYVYNGSSEAWGLWQSREDGNPEPVFNLRCLKSRSGLVDQGTTYQFDGNDEDKRLVYRGMAGRTTTLDQIKSTRDRVVALLQSAGGAALDPKTVNDRLQLGNADYARRLCRQLYEQPSVPVGRKEGSSTVAGGRPAYLYFWAGAEIPDIGVPKPKPPLAQSPQAISKSRVSVHPEAITDQFQSLRQGFGTERDPSEREEREGVEGGFRHDFLSRATPYQESPSTGLGSSWDAGEGDDPAWGPPPLDFDF